jgi:transcriptional regulator with GAF, ATPase, and Fis domain
MSLKILIVEDQFIEANDLRIILERAGHTICGIVKSVCQALDILKRERPEMVLLDIYLKGDLTGIELAKMLAKNNIPFIYLSANSNPSTLEAAKATQPYGFLIKPFREKDILVALDIAGYRYQQAADLMLRHSQRLSNLLDSIINENASHEQKLLMLVKAFKEILSFDCVAIDTDLNSEDLNSIWCFHRVAFDEYTKGNGWEFIDYAKLTFTEFSNFRKYNAGNLSMTYLNDQDFNSECTQQKVANRIREIYNVKSKLWVPISFGKRVGMSVTFYSFDPDGFNTENVVLLNPLRTPISNVIESIRIQKNITSQPLSGGRGNFQGQEPKLPFQEIIGNSPRLLQVLDQVTQVAPSDTSVLILGETGVGKEALVKSIHYLSNRRLKPFVKINCAAIPSSLIESELFGHEKGAFTGASEKRAGKFEQAQGGTIFLDEIGEMPLEVQSKLLRVIQEKELERIGGRTTVKIDVRVIAATNRDLLKEVTAGNFRMDLYYRINVFPIILPPLRERKGDIPLLVNHFLQSYAGLSGNEVKKISPEAMLNLMNYSWPGNIRELQHLIERHILITKSVLIAAVELPEEESNQEDILKDMKFKSMADINKAYIEAVLKRCNGKVSGKGGAAEILKLPPTTLASKMKKLGIGWKYF